MNCDDFGQRLHERLDHRLSLRGDRVLCQHAERCESCRTQMDVWEQISPLIGPTPDRQTLQNSVVQKSQGDCRRVLMTVSWFTGLAAIFLLAFSGIRDANESAQPTMEESSPNTALPLLAQTAEDLDPAMWWRSVQDRDWVGQTMPTVRSVKEGVAPLGRTLMRAVTILTIGGQDQTS